VTSNPAFHRFALAFGTVFAFIYVIARLKGLALFTVYPSLGIVLVGMHRSRDVVDPVFGFSRARDVLVRMDATAALGALVIGSIAALLPARWSRWFWPGWVWLAPVLAMMACLYLTIPWFRQ
jgi:hypothetical protein